MVKIHTYDSSKAGRIDLENFTEEALMVEDEISNSVNEGIIIKIKGNLKRAKQGTICAIMKEHPYTRECLQSICSGHSFPDIYERVIKEFSFE